MCGIAGFSRAPKSSIPHGRKFAIELALAIESRGRHATGFGWFENTDIENVWYAKKQGPAKSVAKDLSLPGRGLSVVAAHTRHFTKGSPAIYENNHPIVCDHIVATHNGRVDNDDELIELSGAERIGLVDSFAIPAILANAKHMGAGHPTELLELVRGVAAVAWLDADEHNVLHLARMSTRPLFIGWTKRGDLVYSSTEATLRKASAAAKVGVHDIVEVKEGTYLRIERGVITEMVEFEVVHPPVKVKEDMPGLSKGTAKRAAHRQPTLPSFDADDMAWWDEYDRYEADRKAERDELFDNLVDTDDGIDWGNLIPRRGWSQAQQGEVPF